MIGSMDYKMERPNSPSGMKRAPYQTRFPAAPLTTRTTLPIRIPPTIHSRISSGFQYRRRDTHPVRSFLVGLALGVLVAGGLTNYLWNRETNRETPGELKNDLSIRVTQVETVPSSTNPPSIPLPEAIASDRALLMVYADQIGGQSYKLTFPVQEYFRHKQMRHTSNGVMDYANWVTYESPVIKEFAKYVTQNLKTPEEKAQRLLDFVHSQIYDSRIEMERDYVKYPIETMVERNGDCEDLSILAAALIKSVGLDVSLVYILPLEGEKSTHMAMGVVGEFKGRHYELEGRKYYYTETTGTDWLTNRSNWKIGEMPKEYGTRPAYVIVIK